MMTISTNDNYELVSVDIKGEFVQGEIMEREALIKSMPDIRKWQPSGNCLETQLSFV